MRYRVWLIVFALLCLALLGYGWTIWRYWYDAPVLTRNLSTEFNAKILAIPERDRAWPLYREALLQIETKPWPQVRNRYSEELEDWRGDNPSLTTQQNVADFLREIEPALTIAHRAGMRPHLGYPYCTYIPQEDALLRPPQKEHDGINEENPMLLSLVNMPEAESRRLRDCLLADAQFRAAEGDGQRACDDLATAMAWSNHLLETPWGVSWMKDDSDCYRNAIFVWGMLMAHYPALFTEQQLLKLEQQASRFSEGRILTPVQRLRDDFDDLVQRTYTDRGQGDGRYCGERNQRKPDSVWAFLWPQLDAHKFASRRETSEAFHHAIDLAEKDMARPLWQAQDRYSIEFDRLSNDKRQPLLNLMLGGSYYLIYLRHEQLTQQRDAILTASALTRYRLRNDTWPDKLTQLVPDFMPAIPPDRFTGKPLCYRLKNDQPLVYSRGVDKIDDDGAAAMVHWDDIAEYLWTSTVKQQKEAEDTPTEMWRWEIASWGDWRERTGDWHLWPVELQPIAAQEVTTEKN